MNEQFFKKYQKLLLKVVNTDAGRALLAKPAGTLAPKKIVKITPSSIYQLEDGEKDIYTATFFTTDIVASILVPIIEKMVISHEEYKPIDNIYEAFLHYSNYENMDAKYPLIFLNQLTFNPVAGANTPSDGVVLSNIAQPGVSFSTLVGGSGTSASVTAATGNCIYAQSATTGSGWVEIDRGVFNFNTLSLSGGTIIGSSTLSLYVNSFNNGFAGSPNVRIVAATPASTSTLANSDYSNFGTTQLAALAISGLATTAYNNFTTTNISSQINKLGTTSFGTRLDWDANNSFGGSYTNSNTLGVNVTFADNGSNIPKLSVAFTAGGLFLVL